MRSPTWKSPMRIAAGFSAVCALAILGGCVAPGAMLEGGESVASPKAIREVRVGYGLDVDGKVPPAFRATKFSVGDPVAMSMWVTEAPSGSMIHVSVFDTSTGRVVWSQDQETPGGSSYVDFDIGRDLGAGQYQAAVRIDSDLVSQTSFGVFSRSER